MTLPRPRVYCASPYPRAKMWRAAQGAATILGPSVTIVSTWHNSGLVEDAVTSEQFAQHWTLDFEQIRKADVLLAYAEIHDKPQGTLVEIGYALAHEMPVFLVGNYPWATWQHYPLVQRFDSLRLAVEVINRATPSGVAEGSSA